MSLEPNSWPNCECNEKILLREIKTAIAVKTGMIRK